MQKKLQLHLLIICFFSFILEGCAPSLSLETSGNAGMAPKPADYNISIFRDGESLPSHARVIGSVHIGDNGFAMDCDLEQVMQLAQEKAREVGGDAIQITETKTPDSSSTCFRINANIIALKERRTAPTQTRKKTVTRQPEQAADLSESKPVKMPSGRRWKKPK